MNAPRLVGLLLLATVGVAVLSCRAASAAETGAAIAVVLEGRGDDDRAAWAWWTARAAGVLLVWSWWSSRNLLKRR